MTERTTVKRATVNPCNRAEDQSDDICQPFPTIQPLSNNLNKTKQKLEALVGGESGGSSGTVRSYKMTSVRLKDGEFCQTGSGPNYQGGFLTLCTCMPHVRAEKETAEWIGTWMAGLVNKDGHIWVFYLAKIGESFESQRDIWNRLPKETQKAKNTRQNPLGDIYEPHFINSSDPFNVENYHAPIFGHTHRCDNNPDRWREDINYFHDKNKRRSAFLLMVPQYTFIWDRPTLYVDARHSRTKTWTSVNHFISNLKSS